MTSMPGLARSLLLLLYLISSIEDSDAELTIAKNSGIDVNYGRSVFLRPYKNLELAYDPTAHCRITVLKNDPMKFQVGALHPASFDCDFGERTVRYQHFGALNRLHDVIKLQAQVDTSTETIVVPFTIDVRVKFEKPLEALSRVQDLIVDELGGLSEPIGPRVLDFNYNNARQKCLVSVISSPSGPPYYGNIINASASGSDEPVQRNIDCRQFLDGTLRYLHKATKSSNRDYVPLVVEVSDKETKRSRVREFIQMPVRIRRAPENQRPTQSFEAVFSLQVDQSVMTAITPDVVAVEDRETPPDQIILNVTRPLKDEEGMLISTDNPNQALATFYQRDIREFKIAYKPRPGAHGSTKVHQIWFEAIDSEGARSVPFYLFIIVKAMNTDAPKVVKNTGLTMFEGQSRTLSTKALEISSLQSLNNVEVSVIAGLKHGRLEMLGKEVRSFKAREMEKSTLRYQHDDSDTYCDNVVFRLKSSNHFVDVLFAVTIIPKDDEAPVVKFNTGAFIEEGGTAQIDQFQLAAVDVDSDDASIMFEVVQLPKAGTLCLRQREQPPDIKSWALVNGFYEKNTTQFEQTDLILGKVHYRHSGTEIFQDHFLFRVADRNEVPNRSGVKTFLIDISRVDDVSPVLFPACPLQMKVMEGKVSTFSKDVLHYTDQDSEDDNLEYIIIKKPFFVDRDRFEDVAGEIVLIENGKHRPVKNFTQRQVNHFKVGYEQTKREGGRQRREVSFVYKVRDPKGNEINDQRFKVFVEPVNNKPPQVSVHTLRVDERREAAISKQEVTISDVDNAEDELRVAITSYPKHGAILLGKKKLLTGDSFTVKDIEGKLVKYHHDGSETAEDEVTFVARDGLHSVPFSLSIAIRPIDDEPPKPRKKDAQMEVPERGAVAITKDIVSGTDEDTDDNELTFMIVSGPKYGTLEKAGKRVNMFKQRDIVAGVIAYKHNGDEIGLTPVTDIIELTLSDMSDDWLVGGNRYNGIKLNVTIRPVDSEPPVVTLGERIRVNEGSEVIISRAMCTVTDVDTKVEELKCLINVQPKHGHLETLSPAEGSEELRTGQRLEIFDVTDLLTRKVKYVQSQHKGNEPNGDQFSIICTDGQNAAARTTVNIVIVPANDEEPVVLVREFVVLENDFLPINLAILNALDGDVPPDTLEFTIVRKPEHGDLLVQKGTDLMPIRRFPKAMLSSDDVTILYQHDGTETVSDGFRLLVSDGKHNVSKDVKITIIPVDDEMPRLMINAGLMVDRGGKKVITKRNLQATDLDSNDEKLKYFVMDGAKLGVLQKEIKPNVYVNLTKGTNFTQLDINSKKIRYVHNIETDGEQDVVRLDVTDTFNRLINQLFYIMVTPKDNIYPDVDNRGVTLDEGGRATLSTDFLSATDINSPDQNLNFIVTKIPKKGHLENTDYPGVPISKFSQLDLAGNKIVYIHTERDEVKLDSFEFEVTDGVNKVLRSFRITLRDVNNKKPVLFLSPIATLEGQSVVITPFELRAEDADNKPPSLKFTITHPPVHGTVTKDGVFPVREFTQEDIDSNRISYQHDGSEIRSDSFSLTVSDGVHEDFFVFPKSDKATSRSQIVGIIVRAVDNRFPVVSKNKGASTLKLFEDGRQGFLFTPDALSVFDRDSSETELHYRITSSPRHGQLVNISAKVQNESITTFTQADIRLGHVLYVLQKGSNATSDVIIFDVVDGGNNEITGQQFYFNWAWVYFSSGEYQVNETDKQVILTIRRRGFLGETSFIAVQLHNDTADDKDYKLKRSGLVQFSPGKEEARVKIKVFDDNEEENRETFVAVLKNPLDCLVGTPGNATVIITDPEDEPRVEIEERLYRVDETVGVVNIPLKRSGDAKSLIRVLCVTESGTAKGTIQSTVTSYKDYVSREADNRESIITFDTDETLKYCPVTIIDDALYEPQESFRVKILPYLKAKIGTSYSQAEVVIKMDPGDEPKVSLEFDHYKVSEDAGNVVIKVSRSGTDLSGPSSVLFGTQQFRPVSARAEQDYIPLVRNLKFAPRETEKWMKITILDDSARPRIEGVENFTVFLRAPLNGSLGLHGSAVVSIDDTVSDLPTAYFEKPSYTVSEDGGTLATMVRRYGDLQYEMFVRCYTRQSSALVAKDFAERRDTNASFIHFKKGEKRKECKVDIVNDTLFESDEQFRLVLGTPVSEGAGGARIGNPNETWVTIEDNDQPVIGFKESKYYVREPSSGNEVKTLEIPVVRTGDLSRPSIVTVHTKDGSAKSGVNYEPMAKLLEFGVNVTAMTIKLQVFYSKEKSLRKAFVVKLRPDANRIAALGQSKTIIYIEETDRRSGVTFPLNPMVVSLQDYDDVESARPNPVQGYPLICVTACNPKFPRYAETSALCNSEKIDNSKTKYRWQVAGKDSADGVTNRFYNVDGRTFFSSPKTITLDSIYFSAGSRVRCVAQAVDDTGALGIESYSQSVAVDGKEGVCMPRRASDLGAETFSAQVTYTGTKDREHPNLIRLRVLIPHFDGLLPVLSTKQLSNFEIALSPDASRIAQHKCSNLLDFNEVETRHGFIQNKVTTRRGVSDGHPYQFDWNLRGNKTLRFYRNLDLDACLWTFESYYGMTELIQKCGGKVTTDGQVRDAVQSHLTVTVPLFVSYIYHSPEGEGKWMDFNHESNLKMTFVYDTAMLWKDGVGPPETSLLKGNLFPTSIKIRDSDKRLVVNFRTKARFRGQFILKSEDNAKLVESVVMSPDQPSLSMTLYLIRSDPTYGEPEQIWQFVSDFAVRDFSGTYIVKLIPCTVTEDIEFSTPLQCTPREPVTFQLPVRFQQTSEPVETKFTLNTRFFLLNRREQWLSSNFTSAEASDVAFVKGSKIYGRVMVDTYQSLGSAYHVVVEKVYLCSGQDGYVPKYDPPNKEYGCLADSTSLLFRFKILDRLAPETEKRVFDNVPFNARLVVNDPDAENLVEQPGADGFSLDSTPLYKVSGGRNWFLHVIYTVRSKAQRNRGLGKRSIEETYHSLADFESQVHSRQRRDMRDVRSIGTNKGTNLQMIRLVYSKPGRKTVEVGGKLPSEKGGGNSGGGSGKRNSLSLVVIILLVVLLLIAILVIAGIIYRKRRQAPPGGTVSTADKVSAGGVDGTEI